ncbi:MAG: baseplate J/gp47 family protein [Oscillospiraceae bacterium]|nr:baseplate J/gp47 family protein [Oscillospiraceae bacterium]
MDLTSPYDNITPESIKSEILTDIRQHSGVDVQEGAFANVVVSGVAYKQFVGYQQMRQMLFAAFPDATAGEFIDKAAAAVGLERKEAAVATAQVTFTGEEGTTIPAQTVVYASVSGLCFRTDADTTVANGSATVSAQAAEGGTEYNVAAGEIDTMYVNVAGVDGVTNLQAASGGTDPESDEALWQRYHTQMTLRPTSGNPDQYIIWALEVPGVAWAQCIPVWNGAGTVKVIIAGEGREPVEPDVLQDCMDHLTEQRVIGAEVTVVSVITRTIDLSADVELDEGYTLEAVRAQFVQLVNELLERVPFGQAVTVPYSKILSCLLRCDGVNDYSALLVDGETDAITITAEQTCIVGTATVTSGGGGA